jgi:hypothetical protein
MLLAELFSTVDDLVAVLERPKRLITLGPWLSPMKGGPRSLKFKASLRDDVATIQGVSLEIRCDPQSFELPIHVVMLASVGGRVHAMARIDLNGDMHVCRYPICGEWMHEEVGGNHFHDTRLHLGIPINDLFSKKYGDLPVARPINDMPKEFSKAMEKCGELLHIENLGEVEEPQWQPRQSLF